jgi:hypothetical protein
MIRVALVQAVPCDALADRVDVAAVKGRMEVGDA